MVIVSTLQPGQHAAWDAFVAMHPHGTFLHRAAWSGLLEQGFRHPSHYLVAQQDGAIVGVLPLTRVKTRLFGDSLISSPFLVYGGPLAASPEALVALESAAIDLMKRLGAPVMEWRFRDPIPGGALGGWQPRDDLYVTFRKPIVANDDANMKAIPRKQRAMVRKGIDKGLTSVANRDVDALFRIYSESVRNLGTPVFPRRWFGLLAAAFGDAMDVVTVLHDGAPVAAVLNFYDERGEVLPYYGGGNALSRPLAAHDFMDWEVMRRAAARGCTGFDFGRSKVGTGSYAFKKNWGFSPTPLLHRFHLAPEQTIPDHNPLNPKYALFIKAWKRLPLPLANLIGPYIVRGVG
jgi:FemAB-related protein (PEP-CTERM system-associated)